MAMVLTDDTNYKNIAQALRDNGPSSSANYKPSEMANVIYSIPPTHYQIGYSEGLGHGKQAEYDAFWDAYQQNGNRTDYTEGFCFVGWTDETFKPKYDITIRGGRYVFYNSRITDLKQRLIDCGVKMLFDNAYCRDLSYFCQNMPVTYLPEIGGQAVTILNYAFQMSSQLKSIDKITASNTAPCNFLNAFQQCYALTDIAFSEDITPNNLNLQWSPITPESMKNIILALKNLTGTGSEYAYTITFNDACWEALEADSTAPGGITWAEYTRDIKGWNI